MRAHLLGRDELGGMADGGATELGTPAVHRTRPDVGPPAERPVTHLDDIRQLDRRDPWFIEQVVRVVERVMFPYHRAEVRGLDRVPPGAALYVGNHSGGGMTIDSFLFGAAVYRAWGLNGLPHALAHDVALRLPGVGEVFRRAGAVHASKENARRLFAAGRKVLVYPGGAHETMRHYRDRNRIRFFGRQGFVRTALRNDVPIVPVVGQGSHATCVVLDDSKWLVRLARLDRLLRVEHCPATLSLPWGLLPFPAPLYLPFPAKIRMEILPPIRFERRGEEAASDEAYVAACAARVEAIMQETIERLARE